METVKSLITLEFRSISKGYEFLAKLELPELSFFEITPMAPGKLLAVIGDDENQIKKIWEFAKKSKKNLIDFCFLPKCNREILTALYGQQKPQALDFVGVAQTKTISKSIHAASAILEIETCRLLEIDSGRSLGGASVFYFTMSQGSRKLVEKLLKKHKCDFTFLPKENSVTRRYFQLV